MPFYMVMDAAICFIKDKIIASEGDNLGIIFYNTASTANHMNFPNLFVYQDLAESDAERVKQLQTLIIERNYTFGHSEALLVDALWLCHDIFTRSSKTYAVYDRKIFLFTDNDAPNSDRPDDAARGI